MFLNIPEELRNIPNWLVWKFENLDQPKPTKVPYDAKNGKLASVSRSETWSTFEQAVAAVPYCSGIGFVLTSDIGFSCIDLDYTGDLELQTKQRLIEEAFNSYSEISPSGKGLHIWVKGTVPSGRRRGPIEVYSTGRYMTMTGQTYRNNVIQENPELLHQLWAEMETSSVTIDTTTDKDQLQDDGEIYEVAANAVNGEKFAALYSGDWEQFYPSQSEADFALVDMLAFYTQNRVQITRMFRNSKLGNRAKALRADYVNKMINRSFDRQLPAVDFDGLKNDLEAKFAEAKQPKEPPKVQKAPKAVVLSSIPQHSYEPPNGLVGELAKFIYSAAPRPVVEIALAGSIGLMAGVCGRAYNISGMGLNQYVMLLANTGSGKEAISSGIDKLMHEVVKTVPAAMEFIGPSEIASPQALIKYMSKTAACFTSLVGEFGLTLKQISSPKANPNQIGLRRAMLELYGKSGAGKIYKPMIYSDKEKNTSVINGPAFSIIGESTPERFYETLDDSMIYEGLLPRFTIMEYAGPRTELNPHHQQAVPDERLIEHFGALAAHCLNMNNGNRVEVVQQSSEAVLAFSDFNVKCDLEINHAHNEITRHLWNRAHVKALKLAAVLAVGENFIQPCVSHENARWAITLIENDVTNMLLKFENGDIGTPQAQNEQLKDIQKAFSKYLCGDWNSVEKYPGATGLSHHNKVVPQSFITGYCRSRASFKHDRLGPVQAIKTTIMSMMECGEVIELSVADKKALQLPVNGKCYMVHASVKWL